MIALPTLGFLSLALAWLSYSRLPWPVSDLPSSIPWVGRRNEVFSKLRACIREVFAGLRTLSEGYVTVGVLVSQPDRS